MKKLLLIFLLLPVLASSQWLEMGKQKIGNKVGIQSSGAYQWALDFDGSTEYLSCTPALRLTGEYSAVYPSITGDTSFACSQVYGSWTFTVNKTGDNDIVDLYFINDLNSLSGNSGYLFKYGNNEKMYLYSVATGTPTARITSSGTFAIATNHTVIITRNTNGAFDVTVNGTSIGTVTNATYTNSNYCFTDYTGTAQITSLSFQQGEGSLDLNSYERIYHSDNRNFTKTGGLAWVGAGTHSIDTTSTDKRTGSYSGKVISTDVGDSTTNYISLPAVNFDTLETDANGIYEKYTLEFWCKSKALSRVIIKVGNQVKTSDTISNIAFEKVVFNFQSNALVSNQPILLYVNQADTVYLDDVSLTKAYDVSYNYWINTASANASITSNNSVKDWASISSNKFLHQVDASSTDWVNIYRFTSSNVNTSTWNYLTAPYNRITATAPNVYFNGALNNGIASASSMANAGKVGIATTSLLVGLRASLYYTGKLGHIQITKFTDISQSNVNSTTLTTAYNRGKLIQGEWTGGSPIEVAFYDWKGADATEMLRDKSGAGNNLTGTNIDLNDRVKVKSKFK